MQQTFSSVITSRSRWVVLALLSVAASVALALGSLPSLDAQESVLRDHAQEGLAVGAVLHGYDPAWDDGDYPQVAAAEFNAVTATAYMPWGPWPVQAGPIDTSGLTDVVSWARQRGQLVHGHTLVYPLANEQLGWYQDLPRGRGLHEAALEQYVSTMASATAGDMWVWDVVNEVLADPGDPAVDSFGLRTGYVEYQEIGPSYVDKAFAWAKAADPNALLIINDYGAEQLNEKSDNLLRYAIELRRRGVPVDGVGFQMHIQGQYGEPDYLSIRRNFERFEAAGFRIYITELDVMTKVAASANETPSAAETERQAAIYKEIARIASEYPSVESLLMWDFADDRSWLHPTITTLGQVPQGVYTFPAPFAGGAGTDPLIKKSAYFGLAEGLRDGLVSPTTFAPGRYSITSLWQPSTSHLATSGGDIALTTAASADGWLLEAAGDGYYRLRAGAGQQTQYLTRGGVLNDRGVYEPGNRLELHGLQDWSSQLWRFEADPRGGHRLRNAWGPGTGLIGRDGIANDGGGYDPGATASLYDRHDNWTSQRWTVTPTASACGSLSGEAEDAELSGAFRMINDATASGSTYVVAVDGTTKNMTAPDLSKSMTFCFSVPRAGDYRIEGTTIATTIQTDSFWVSIDQQAPAIWHVRQSADWTASPVRAAPSRDALVVSLEAGEHAVTFLNREPGIRLDRVELVALNSPVCAGATQEAEAGRVLGAMAVSSDPTASGGELVGMPTSASSRYTLNAAHRVDICIVMPVAGTYTVRAETIAPTIRNDSFWVQVNDAAPVLWHVPRSTTWRTTTVRDAATRDTAQFAFDAGENRLTFYAREAGTFIDQVSVR